MNKSKDKVKQGRNCASIGIVPRCQKRTTSLSSTKFCPSCQAFIKPQKDKYFFDVPRVRCFLFQGKPGFTHEERRHLSRHELVFQHQNLRSDPDALTLVVIEEGFHLDNRHRQNLLFNLPEALEEMTFVYKGEYRYELIPSHMHLVLQNMLAHKVPPMLPQSKLVKRPNSPPEYSRQELIQFSQNMIHSVQPSNSNPTSSTSTSTSGSITSSSASPSALSSSSQSQLQTQPLPTYSSSLTSFLPQPTSPVPPLEPIEAKFPSAISTPNSVVLTPPLKSQVDSPTTDFDQKSAGEVSPPYLSAAALHMHTIPNSSSNPLLWSLAPNRWNVDSDPGPVYPNLTPSSELPNTDTVNVVLQFRDEDASLHRFRVKEFTPTKLRFRVPRPPRDDIPELVADVFVELRDGAAIPTNCQFFYYFNRKGNSLLQDSPGQSVEGSDSSPPNFQFDFLPHLDEFPDFSQSNDMSDSANQYFETSSFQHSLREFQLFSKLAEVPNAKRHPHLYLWYLSMTLYLTRKYLPPSVFDEMRRSSVQMTSTQIFDDEGDADGYSIPEDVKQQLFEQTTKVPLTGEEFWEAYIGQEKQISIKRLAEAMSTHGSRSNLGKNMSPSYFEKLLKTIRVLGNADSMASDAAKEHMKVFLKRFGSTIDQAIVAAAGVCTDQGDAQEWFRPDMDRGNAENFLKTQAQQPQPPQQPQQQSKQSDTTKSPFVIRFGTQQGFLVWSYWDGRKSKAEHVLIAKADKGYHLVEGDRNHIFYQSLHKLIQDEATEFKLHIDI